MSAIGTKPTSNHVRYHVGFREQSGLHVLRLRIVEFDPKRTFKDLIHPLQSSGDSRYDGLDQSLERT
jgi:hypothetical protein